jgi:hypothetical protein
MAPEQEGGIGSVTFSACEPVERQRKAPASMSPVMRETMDAYAAGAIGPTALASALGCSVNVAKQRLHRLHAWLAENEEE